MQDPKLIDPAAPRIPEEWRQKYLRRPLEDLPKDLTVLFDRHTRLEREKNLIQGDLLEAKSSLKVADLKIWILIVATGVEGCVIGWLVNAFLARIK